MSAQNYSMARLVNLLQGCGTCVYDEAEGGLIDHCPDCMRKVTTEAYGLMEMGAFKESHDPSLAIDAASFRALRKGLQALGL